MGAKRLALGGLFIALALALPSMFHLLGLGKVFLPMHIPVLLSGFVCGPLIGAVVGAVSPILSAVMTGMPPLMPPTAQAMAVELCLYGLVTGYLYERQRLGAYVSLIASMIVGRIGYGLVGYLILPLFGIDKVPWWAPLAGAIGTSLPGIAVQLALIPPAISLLEKDVKALLPERR